MGYFLILEFLNFVSSVYKLMRWKEYKIQTL
jgi:hypothetical protein